ncbi:MAG: hypothetical protein ACU0BK_09895 [Shimia sp.]|uniref:hypothetical protein n=1 Tax=Shimia sp. TaxID=1954381 RepID=UPI00405813F3
MDYSFTGKLGVGANVNSFFAAQRALKVQFDKVPVDEPWAVMDWKMSFCPCVYRPEELLDSIENSDVDSAARVIYLCGAVDLQTFNLAADGDAQSQLFECLVDAAAAIEIEIEDFDLMPLMEAVRVQVENAWGAGP